MNTNKILSGGIAGGLAYFLLGWVIYGMALAGFMASHTNQCAIRPMEEMLWWAMILSNLIGGILLAMIISWAGSSSPGGGAKTGAIVGLLMGLCVDLSFYSMSTMYNDVSAVAVDILAYTVMSAIAGAVIGWVMGMGKKA
jgi:fluoride ion exporter CrcB/FEX